MASLLRRAWLLAGVLAVIAGLLGMHVLTAGHASHGSGSQNAVGTGVIGGMVTATILAIFFVPVFFVVVRRRFGKKKEESANSHPVEHNQTH